MLGDLNPRQRASRFNGRGPRINQDGTVDSGKESKSRSDDAMPRRWTLTCNKIVNIKYGTGKHRKMIRYDVPKTAAVETRWRGKNTWVRERT